MKRDWFRTLCASIAIGAALPAAAAKVDFCGSALADIPLINSSTRQIAVWCDGNPNNSVIFGPYSASGWAPYGIGNFDSGAFSDVLLYNYGTGEVSIWPSGNASAGTITGTVNTAQSYSILQSFGDFNGDGRDDLILYSPTTRNIAVWYSGQVSTSALLGQAATGWHPVLVADVNGDGQADLILTNTSTHEFSYWLSGNPALSHVIGSPGPSWIIMATGSFTRDPPACDIMWYNVKTGGMATSQNCASETLTAFSVAGKLGWPQRAVLVDNLTGTSRSDILISALYTNDLQIFDSGRSDPDPSFAFIATPNVAAGWNVFFPHLIYFTTYP